MKDISFLISTTLPRGPAFVLQLFSPFFWGGGRRTCVHAHIIICMCTLIIVVCAGASRSCFKLILFIWLCAVNSLCVCVLTAVFIAGSTWRPTPSPQAWCWWRRCPETRWARSTRRTSCDTSSHEWTASAVYMTSHRFPAEVILAVLAGRLYLFYPLPVTLIINSFVCHCVATSGTVLEGPIILSKLNWTVLI